MDLDPVCTKSPVGFGKRTIDDQLITDQEHIRPHRFRGIDLDHLEAVEECGVHPVGIEQDHAPCRLGASGLEMEAPGVGSGPDLVPERGQELGKLPVSFRAASWSCTDPEGSFDSEHITTIERPRTLDFRQRPQWLEGGGHRRALTATRRRTGSGHHRDFRQHQGSVLDEHAVREIRILIQSPDLAAEAREAGGVGAVLGPGTIKIDRGATQMGQFTGSDSGTDGSRECDHGAGDCSICNMSIEFNLTGRRAVVGGGTRGIGRAIVEAFAEAGASVTVAGRDRARLEETIAGLPGSGHDIMLADSGDLAAVEQAVTDRAERGPVHILVNNTGGPAAGPASAADPEQFIQAFGMHLAAGQVMVRGFTPAMKEAGYGRIINVISTSVVTPIPGLGVSNTIRGAVANWGRTLAVELGAFGITVNNLLPGFTGTDRLASLFEGKAKRLGCTPEEIREQAIRSIPAARIAEPEELAAVALFLASPAGSYVNGVNLPVDGGRVAKG